MQDIEIFVPEFEYREKNRLWYLSFTFFVLLFIFLAMLTNNVTFIAVVALGATLTVMRGFAKPQTIPLAINDKGIYFKHTLWPYEGIKNFSLYEIDGKKYLIFTPIARFQTAVKVQIENTDAIRNRLNNLLPEVEYHESLMDILIRIVGL